MADPYKTLSITNTGSNAEFAVEVGKALNSLEAEGFKPEPGFIFRNGHHVVLVGKRKRRPAKKAK